MSSSQAAQPNNKISNRDMNRPSTSIVPAKNPYAKRKRNNDNNNDTNPSGNQNNNSQQPPSHTNHPRHSAFSPLGGTYGANTTTTTTTTTTTSTTTSGSTFSQAFGAIEDTVHYKNSVAEFNRTLDAKAAAAATAAAALRAEQRAFEESNDQSTATAEQPQTHSHSDRDHHAMLQPHVLSVSFKQRGNGVLNYIRNVPFAYAKMVPDYVMGPTTCALFLSLKYHNLHPTYIYRRVAEIKHLFQKRILLVLVDLEDNVKTLRFLNTFAVQQELSLILSWTEEEAARYLETYKAMDGNDASLIQRKEKTNFVDQATEVLTTSGTSVNKTDASELLTQFDTMKAIMSASHLELGLISGLGPKKVRRLYDAFHKPFSTKKQRERQQRKAEAEEAKQLVAAENDGDDDDDDDDDKETKNSNTNNETEMPAGDVPACTIANSSKEPTAPSDG